MKAAIGLGVLFAISLFVWLAGVRVIVIQSIGALPEGVTAIVAGLPGARLIDSPDAICYRRNYGVSLLCRGITAGAIAKEGRILLRLPYSETLFGWTGGPFREG